MDRQHTETLNSDIFAPELAEWDPKTLLQNDRIILSQPGYKSDGSSASCNVAIMNAIDKMNAR
jgi:hypothetical protein